MKIIRICGRCKAELEAHKLKLKLKCPVCEQVLTANNTRDVTVYTKTEKDIDRVTTALSANISQHLNHEGVLYVQAMGTALSALLVKQQMECAGQLPREYE